MPSPSTEQTTLRPDLGEAFMEFDLAMQAEGYIAHKIFPVFEAPHASGPYPIIPAEQLLKTVDTKRAPGAAYNEDNFTFTNGVYTCEDHGIQTPIDARERKMYKNFFDAELVAAETSFDKVLGAYEARVAAKVFDPVVYTGSALTTAVGTEWSTVASATPVDDVRNAKIMMYNGSGLWPNTLVINQIVFENLKDNAQIIERVKYTGMQNVNNEDMTPRAIARALGLAQVLVAGSTQNTANEGQAGAYSPFWSSEYAMLCLAATSNNLKKPAIGRTFHWDEDGSSITGTIESWHSDVRRSDFVRVRHDVDEVMLYPQAGHLLSNITG